MKKLISLLLALALIMSMSIPAFAQETTTTVTINNSEGRTYVGHKLLNLSTSLKGDNHHPDTCDGINHADDCYNYAYTVNDTYRAILQAETYANGRNELWLSGKPATSAGVTDAQILEYLSYQSSDNGDVYMTMRQVADRIYRAIQTAGIPADDETLTGTDDTIDQGYWMFVDTTELTEYASNSLVMVDTAGKDAITITPKTALPTIEKKVKDIDDSEDDKILDNEWVDSADHDFNDPVPFKLTATLPSNAQQYEAYTMIFHDTLSAGLTLKAGSIKVLMYETKHKADVDTDLNDFIEDVTDSFVVTTEGLGDSCTFEVSCENVFAIEGVTKDTAFVVSYEATLNINAVIGNPGNPNEVYLEFSNNPYGDGTGKTEKDTVIVYTYQLVINKVDSHGHALEGATFKLYKKNLSGEFILIDELSGDHMTIFTWSGLDDGDYKLEESVVPEGYNKMSDIAFSISANHTENGIINLDGGVMGMGVAANGVITKDIENKTGTVLPETGAQGTFLLLTASSMFVMVAAVFMITRKKMSIYED